jgi:uncharacterized protein
MAVLVDTSALYSVIVATDATHSRAVAILTDLAERRESMVTTNYVIVETVTLLGRRAGMPPVRDFLSVAMPSLRVHWVSEDLHDHAVAVLVAVGRRDLSLVDCVSLELMRQLGLDTAFAFDEHFNQQGFRTL